jgi:hypothetical protein
MYVCMYYCMYVLYVCIVCMDGWMDGWMDGCTYVRMYVCDDELLKSINMYIIYIYV